MVFTNYGHTTASSDLRTGIQFVQFDVLQFHFVDMICAIRLWGMRFTQLDFTQ